MQFNNDRYKLSEKQNISCSSTADSNLLHCVIKELNQNQDYEKILCEANKKFQIKQYNILNLSPLKALEIYKSLKGKFYSEQANQVFIDQWCDNELRLFIWLFVCYLYVFKRNFEQMTKKDWLQFSEVFNNKTPYLFQYQAKIIKKTNKKSKKWCSQQDQCLSVIIRGQSTLLRSIKSYKWSQIAKKLFIESNKKYFRTPKQCRQRWINHLDPEKVKSKWTLAEDCSLVSYVIKMGKKWALIAKQMSNKRTEHMVKNRYNSLLKTELKKFEEMADENRVIKKLHYRLKYALESKNGEKQNKQVELQQKAEKVKEEQSQISLIEGNCYLKLLDNEQQIQQMDDIGYMLKENQPIKTSLNLMELEEQSSLIGHIKEEPAYFLFQPNYPDFF